MEKSFIPIILGITGHRDIPKEDYEPLKKKIKGIIDELKKKYPSTPLIFLTPLAEGADRIAAMAAKKNGIEYIVPLPMPIEEYKKDFNDESSLREFDELLKGAKDFFVIPSQEYNQKNNKEHNQEQVERNKLYENVGVYIAKYSSILIALWDGKVSNGQGGTAEVVGYKLNGIPSEYMENTIKIDHADNGPVYHIMTRRTMYEKLPHKCITVTKLYPPYLAERGNAEKEYNTIFKSIDKSNEDIINSMKN